MFKKRIVFNLLYTFSLLAICLPFAGKDVLNGVSLIAGAIFLGAIVVALTKFRTKVMVRHVVHAVKTAIMSCVIIWGGFFLTMALENNLIMKYCIRQEKIAFSLPFLSDILTQSQLQFLIDVVSVCVVAYMIIYVMTVCRFEWLLLTKYKGADPDNIPVGRKY